MQFRKLKSKFFILVAILLMSSLAYADKFPSGYPECWQDTKNPIILNLNSKDQFCPLNSKVGHRFFMVDFTSPLAKLRLIGFQEEYLDQH